MKKILLFASFVVIIHTSTIAQYSKYVERTVSMYEVKMDSCIVEELDSIVKQSERNRGNSTSDVWFLSIQKKKTIDGRYVIFVTKEKGISFREEYKVGYFYANNSLFIVSIEDIDCLCVVKGKKDLQIMVEIPPQKPKNNKMLPDIVPPYDPPTWLFYYKDGIVIRRE